MANSIFEMFKNTGNPVFNMFGGQQNFQQRFAQFANQFRQSNTNSPEAVVRQMISSGQMTQEQFNQYRTIANQITGRNM